MSRFATRGLATTSVLGIVSLAAPAAAQCPGRFELFNAAVPRHISAAFWDPSRSLMVAVEASSYYSTNGQTWTWDGTAWQLKDIDGPVKLNPLSVTWDTNRSVGVAVTPGGQTWEWNGSSWMRRANLPVVTGEPHAVAFDSTRNKTVLLTGAGKLSIPAMQMWEWDGAAWTQRLVALPPKRSLESLTYDPIRQRLVMFGGQHEYQPQTSFPPNFFNDTWEFDGSVWTQINSPTKPFAAAEHGATFDPVLGRVVIYGGFALDPRAQMWSWNGVDWTAIPHTEPGLQSRNSLIADTAANRLLMVTLVGTTDSTGKRDPDGWEIFSKATDGAWVSQVRRSGRFPITNGRAAMAYDRARGVTVLFGGTVTHGGVTGETWEFDGDSWTQRNFTNGPAPRWGAAMAYDPERSRMVMVGGTDGSSEFAETWEYDGTAWTRRSTSAIAARRNHSLAYDPVHHRMVMHGGYKGADPDPRTYTWNGSAWTLRSTTNLDLLPIAFDYNSNRVIGFDQATYSYNGVATWSLVSNADNNGTGPLAWHDTIGAVVAWRGYGQGSATSIRKWTGSAWTAVSSDGDTVPLGDLPQMAYDSRRDRLLVYGGQTDELWQWYLLTTDMGRAGGLSGPDGRLDNNDFIVFINSFFAEDPRADLGVAGGRAGSDRRFDNNDFIAFIDMFFNGCGL